MHFLRNDLDGAVGTLSTAFLRAALKVQGRNMGTMRCPPLEKRAVLKNARTEKGIRGGDQGGEEKGLNTTPKCRQG